MTFSEQCAVLAFYGVKFHQSQMQALYLAVTNWLESIGQSPTSIAVDGKGYGDKVLSFSRTHSRLIRTKFEDVTGFTIYSGIPGETIPSNQYLATAMYSPQLGIFCIAARDSIASLGGDSMLPIAKDTLRILTPDYGIGYHRNYQLGPIGYAVGILKGLGIQGLGIGLTAKEQQEADEITKWGLIGIKQQVYRQGLIRDIYPWNFLTEFQYRQLIDGVPLQRWIETDPSRGKLSRITDAMMLWEVEDAQAPAIRSVLWDAGIIFDWRKFVEDKPSERLSPEESLRRVLEDAQSKGVDLNDLQVLRGGSGAEVPTAELKKLLKKPRRSKK